MGAELDWGCGSGRGWERVTSAASPRGWVAAEGTRPRISNRVRLDIHCWYIRGRVPSVAPTRARLASLVIALPPKPDYAEQRPNSCEQGLSGEVDRVSRAKRVHESGWARPITLKNVIWSGSPALGDSLRSWPSIDLARQPLFAVSGTLFGVVWLGWERNHERSESCAGGRHWGDAAADIPTVDIQSNAVGYPRPRPFSRSPPGADSLRSWRAPTHAPIRTLNQVPHPLIFVQCYKKNLRLKKFCKKL